MIDYKLLALIVSSVAALSHLFSFAYLRQHSSNLLLANLLYSYGTFLLKETDFVTNLHVSQGYIDKTLDDCLQRSDCSIIQSIIFCAVFVLMVLTVFYKHYRSSPSKELFEQRCRWIKSLYLFLEAVAKWLFIAIVVQSLVQLNRVDSSLSIFQLVLWTGFAFFNIFASKFIDDQPAWAITSHRFSAGKRHRFLKTWFIDALEFINEAIQGVIIFLAYWNQWASITSAVLLMICEVLMITLKIAFEKHVTPGGQESLFVKKLNVVCKTIECTFLVLEGAIIVYSLLYLALHENWKDYEYIIAFLISFLVFAEALKIIVKIIVIKTTRVKEKANYEQLI